MSHLFPPNRELLYPQFETYRLHPLEPDSDLTSYRLPGSGATQSRLGYGQQHLSFKEVRSRIGWDHLSVGSGGRGVYVDVDWAVIGFVIGENLKPTFTKLAELPVPVSSSAQQGEFPSALELDATHWAISTGSGSLYILHTTDPSEAVFSASLIARYDLLLPSASDSDAGASSSEQLAPSPFLLRAAHTLSPGDTRLLLTRSVRPRTEGKGKITAVQNTTFELVEIRLDPTRSNGVDAEPETLDVVWQLAGGDLPVWTAWSGEGWVILSAEEYKASTSSNGAGNKEDEVVLARKEREARIAKLGLGASLPPTDQAADIIEASDEPMEPDDAKEYPFSWTQTSDSVNITIPLPAGTSKADISISLTSTTFSFALAGNASQRTAQLEAFLSKATRSWWTTIDPAASTWTFDPSSHILELDLSKVDENTRWPSVFAPSDSIDDDDEEEEEEEEVPETLSASTLAAVRETFNNIRTRGPDEPEGMHPAIPALLREEMDFDLENDEDFGEGEGELGAGSGGKVGRDVFVGYVKDGRASWSKTTAAVLSTPLAEQSGVIVKSAVDGLHFAPSRNEASDPSRSAWRHVSTSPALAFVISSKRDLRLVRHLTSSSNSNSSSSSQTTVLAFDSGSSSAGQGNMYVYYPAESRTHARQGVIGVSGGDKGALLGVGAVEVAGRQVVLALCEKELVVLHGVL